MEFFAYADDVVPFLDYINVAFPRLTCGDTIFPLGCPYEVCCVMYGSCHVFHGVVLCDCVNVLLVGVDMLSENSNMFARKLGGSRFLEKVVDNKLFAVLDFSRYWMLSIHLCSSPGYYEE